MSGINGIGNSDITRVLAEMRNHATQAQGVKPQEQVAATPGAEFSTMLKSSIDKVNEMQQISKANVTAFEMGDPNVSLADAMVSMQKSSIAFQAMTQVRNKVVQAYQEVMSMPV